MTDDRTTMAGWGELDPDVEAKPMTAAQKAELKKKNLVIGGALLAFVALVFLVTIAKLAQNFGT